MQLSDKFNHPSSDEQRNKQQHPNEQIIMKV